MITLAIDTTTDRLTVAARVGDGPIAVREAAGNRRHAGLLGPLALEALAAVGHDLARLERLLMADGPGSFTGLRIGAAWAKGIAMARAVRLETASTLLVRAAGHATDRSALVLGVGSALRGELYVAGYRLARGTVETVIPPTVLAHGAPLDGFVPERIVTDLPAAELAAWPWAGGVEIVEAPQGRPHAAALLDLVGWKGGTVPVDDPGGWEPTYGRPSEAQTRWEREHGRPLADSIGHA